MTPEEAKAKYEAEWPALNAAKEAATNPDEAKKCRQQLSRLSTACRARFELTKPDPEVSEVESLRQQVAAKQAEVDALMLEYCPSEMSQEQLDNWAAHQRPAKEFT